MSRQKAKGNCDAATRRVAASLTIAFCLLLPAFRYSAFAAQAQKKEIVYVCPMHADVKAKKPGKCPKCQMALRAAGETNDTSTQPASVISGNDKSQGSIKPLQIPDTVVYDQNGRKLRFYSDIVKGNTVAINFIFTTCTTICPPLTATFRKVQQDLDGRVGRDVTLISISVDPVTDVPERLKAFAAKFNAGPGWVFITGDKSDIDSLLKALGAWAGDKNDHTPALMVGNDAAGYWTRAYGLAPASAIVRAITDAAAKKPSPSASVEAPKRDAADQATTSQSASQTDKAKTPAEAAASYFTNTVLMTQDNKPVRFFDDLLKGKVVLINFMFTTCTAICPPMTANLQKVQESLGERVGRDINMISISVDPAVDTPEMLKKYAANFKAGPGWFFLTGKKENLDVILRKLGGYVEDKNQHSGILIVGNIETGEWMKMFAMAKPSEIASAVLKIAGGK